MATNAADFPVAILAGGLATRLRPITAKIPKLLVEVAGEPFFSHQLRLLKKNGLTRIGTKRGQAADIDIDRCGSRPKLPAWLANSDSNSPGPATT